MPTPTTYKITVSENVEFPAGTVPEYAPTGMFSGMRLPSGELLKPWTQWELAEDEEGCEDNPVDLTYEQLTLRDVMPGLDYERDYEELDPCESTAPTPQVLL